MPNVIRWPPEISIQCMSWSGDESRTEIHSIQNFGGHLGRHLGKYATVIDFYIFELHVLHFIWIDTSFVFVSESRAEIHSIQNFGGHLGCHLGKYCNCCYWFLHIWTLRPSLHMNRHFICVCIWKAELRYIRALLSDTNTNEVSIHMKWRTWSSNM